MYKALYRKYRPITFDKIVGQTHVIQTLENAIINNKIGHAYLFHGPRGTGKTSIAKIFAEAVNCTGNGPLPCHSCKSCQLIDGEQTTDIIELDAASNNGVDEIRLIREFAKYAPTGIKYKVYIIDEVHMLSTAAFNALLKTLEEPPAHVIFILATTEIHKIPMTIISRTQRFDFKKITITEMLECLNPIVLAEELTITDDALAYIADYADGGMRDALSMLDQVIAYSNGVVDIQAVLEVIGSVGDKTYKEMLDYLFTSNTEQILKLLTKISDSGKNIQLFVEEFLKYLLKVIEKGLTEQEEYPVDILFAIVGKLNQLAYEMKTAYLPYIALQALFLELSYTMSEKRAISSQPEKKPEKAMSLPPTLEVVDEVEKKQKPQVEKPLVEEIKKPQIEEQAQAKTLSAREDLTDLFNYDYFEHELSEDVNESIDIVFDFAPKKEPILTHLDTNANPDKKSTPISVKTAPKIIQEIKPQDIFDSELHIQKMEVQLQRVMAEVVIYPESNKLDRIKRKWQTISFDPNNQIAMMLQDMEPKIGTTIEVLLSTYNKSLANQLQLKINKIKVEEYITILLGQAYRVIVTDEGMWQKQREIFANKWRAHEVTCESIQMLAAEELSLEKRANIQESSNINLELEITETEIADEVVQDAVAIFGDIVKTID
ncbi:hypothetical protein AwErysi_04730 [Erysipelotrichaceae bacterium]|nr:hypothetical protein AwErysi_04730 [Erysipelotrichaceae bacterium]